MMGQGQCIFRVFANDNSHYTSCFKNHGNVKSMEQKFVITTDSKNRKMFDFNL